MMKLLLLLTTIWTACAFKPHLPCNARRLPSSFRATKEQQGVNMDRVRECANSFGKCSVDELKALKDDIVTNRVQQFVLQGDVSGTDLRLLEEEIDIQIGLLETQNNVAAAAAAAAASKPLSFSSSDPEHHVKFDGHLLDVPSAADIINFEETLAEENLLEPLAMCLVVAALVFLPQLLS